MIIGPSGTGKELVAQAIGYSRYLAFDENTRSFVETFTSQFHALNVSALSHGVVESELFGHRGAFTGALEDRQGWLEVCGPDGSVFLDEIGELGTELQVKAKRAPASTKPCSTVSCRARPCSTATPRSSTAKPRATSKPAVASALTAAPSKSAPSAAPAPERPAKACATGAGRAWWAVAS